jgi:DNA-binding response OmpR family regulator
MKIKKIFITMYDAVLGNTVKYLLCEKGYTVRHAVALKSAYQELNEGIPHLIIAEDVIFPQLGRDFLQKVIELTGRKEWPLMVLYGSDTGENRDFCHENGVIFIRRPLDEKKLTREIIRIIRHQSGVYRFFHKNNYALSLSANKIGGTNP